MLNFILFQSILKYKLCYTDTLYLKLNKSHLNKSHLNKSHHVNGEPIDMYCPCVYGKLTNFQPVTYTSFLCPEFIDLVTENSRKTAFFFFCVSPLLVGSSYRGKNVGKFSRGMQIWLELTGFSDVQGSRYMYLPG